MLRKRVQFKLFIALFFLLVLGLIVYKNKEFYYKEAEIVEQFNGSKILASTTTTIQYKFLQGELGVPVNITRDSLDSFSERKKFDDGWSYYGLNKYASDLIAVNRTLPDIRDFQCRSITLSNVMPSVTIILVYHNEAWSVLLRTIHSIFERSDPAILKEFIVIDDFSSLDISKELDEYLSKYEVIKFYRTEKREGILRSRTYGMSKSTGEVLVFLDGHCEVTEGWLEPLIDPIAANPKVSTVPVIETIGDNTFQLYSTSIDTIQIGGFDWTLVYDTIPIPKREIDRRQKKTDPIRSPTMAGEIFAINKNFFESLGAYDPDMDEKATGGEHLELAFKIWMCGGEIQVIPCSHVGHVYSKKSPYKWPVSNMNKNKLRIAEVWMDEYKENYYERIQNVIGYYGDVSPRKELRKSLQCQSFDWYLTNVYPEQHVPIHAKFYGEIRNQLEPQCLDAKGDVLGEPIMGVPCHGRGGNQYWLLSDEGEIRRDTVCFDYSDGKESLGVRDKIITYPCHGEGETQKWSFEEGGLIKHSSGYCIELSIEKISIYMAICDVSQLRQTWKWRKRGE